MLTSSSFDSEEVRRSRQEEYSHVHDGEGLFAFHRSHAPARSAYSTCMHRADAETVSFSWIQVVHARKRTSSTRLGRRARSFRVCGSNSRAVLPATPANNAKLGPGRFRKHRKILQQIAVGILKVHRSRRHPR